MNSVDIDVYAERLVSDIADVIVGEVFHVAAETLKEAISSTVYSRQGSMYQNTYQLLNAVEVTEPMISNGVATFEVRIDSGKLEEVPHRPDWPAYGSLSGGWNSDDGIVDTLENGSNGSPFYNHPGHGFFGKAETVLDGRILTAMASGLASHGYEITYV